MHRITPADAETITKDRALEMLTKNTRNRPFQESRIQLYAHQLRKGEWEVNGESVKFSTTGILMDGQNRLAACVRTGIPLVTLVIYDIPDSVFNTIDTGKSRSAADVLAISTLGTEKEIKTNRTSIAAALKLIDAYKAGLVSVHDITSSHLILNKDMGILIKKYPGVDECLKMCSGSKGLIAPSHLAAFYYITSNIDWESATDFIHDFISGANLDEYDPVYIVREMATSKSYRTRKSPTYWMFGLLIKAWNLRRDGLSCKSLRLSDKESFPTAT